MQQWTVANIPSQRGKLAVVTGANSGLGFCVALELAKAGASVILAYRDEAKGTNALARIRAQVRRARVSLERLNLAELESVQAFAEKIVRRGKLDLLVNNAGILARPKRETTADGFEMQLGVNHLGHFCPYRLAVAGTAAGRECRSTPDFAPRGDCRRGDPRTVVPVRRAGAEVTEAFWTKLAVLS
jgi:NAD(P)-dependent dehydrogenase (short-subunit alcohol dehydrogenase family)